MVPRASPSSVQACASNCTVEVLPLVPVTPTIVIARDGRPWKRSASSPRRARRPGTAIASAGARQCRPAPAVRTGSRAAPAALRLRRRTQAVRAEAGDRDEGIARLHRAAVHAPGR